MSMRRAYDYFAYYLAGVLFFGTSLLLNLLCLVGLALPARDRLSQPLRRGLRRFFRFYFRALRVLGVAKVELPELDTASGARVWVMNHPTIVDAVYLLSLIPQGVCIYKDAIAASPFYGGIAKLARHLPAESGPDMIRSAVERLERGEHLIVFPEGTRTSKFDASRFKGGFALIAKRAGVPVQALWLDNPPDFLTRESGPWKPPSLPVTIRLRELGGVQAERGANVSQISARVASLYRRHLQDLEPSTRP